MSAGLVGQVAPVAVAVLLAHLGITAAKWLLNRQSASADISPGRLELLPDSDVGERVES